MLAEVTGPNARPIPQYRRRAEGGTARFPPGPTGCGPTRPIHSTRLNHLSEERKPGPAGRLLQIAGRKLTHCEMIGIPNLPASSRTNSASAHDSPPRS